MRLALASVLAYVLALALAAPTALADDDPAALLRQARVAETVERDPAKALDLYRRAFEAGGTSEAARDAALAAASLLEAGGKPDEAFKTLSLLTERMGAALDDATKGKVHEAMARLAPEGVVVKTPLGEVIRAVPLPGTSPLDQKIQALLTRLDDVDPQKRYAVENDIKQTLWQVGKDALPVLERAMLGERPERAQFAARTYAAIGGEAALPGLERALRTGDGFTRGAALQGLRSITNLTNARPGIVALIDRVIDLDVLADKRQELRGIEASAMDPAEMVERHAKGGPEAFFWLAAAVGVHAPGSLERAVEAVRSGDPEAKTLLPALGTYAGGKVGNVVNRGERVDIGATDPALDPALREKILELLLAQAPDEASAEAVASVAATAASRASPQRAAEIALGVWKWALAPESTSLRSEACEPILDFWVLAPPHDLFDSAERATRFFDVLADAYSHGNHDQVRAQFARVATTDGAFFDHAAGALAKMDKSFSGEVAALFGRRDAADTPTRWLDLLVGQAPSEAGGQAVAWVAARMQPPRLTEEAGAAAALAAWTYALRLEGDARASAAMSLASVRVGPPHALFADANVARAWFAVVAPRIQELSNQGSLPHLFTRVLGEDGPFWDAFLDAATGFDAMSLKSVLDAMRGLTGPAAPARLGPRWVEFVGHRAYAAAFAWGLQEGILWPARAAAKHGGVAFLDLLRKTVLVPQWTSTNWAQGVLSVLPDYAGPGRLEFALDALAHPKARHSVMRDFVLELLPAQGGEAQVEAIAKLVGERRDDAAAALLEALVGRRAVAHVVRLAEVEASAATPGSTDYRKGLIRAVSGLHLREAIPFLLREFKEGLSSQAAQAMDEIRAYHERLASFEAWSKGGGGARKDLAALLADPDAEIRRAAVLSIAALGEVDALPTLVRLAKEDADGRVRAAALEAVERLSKPK